MNDHSLTPASPFEHPVVRMRTPADMVDALPYLLGFFPSDSLSSRCVHVKWPRGRTGEQRFADDCHRNLGVRRTPKKPVPTA